MKKVLPILLLLTTVSGAAPAATRPAGGAAARGAAQGLSPEERKELEELVAKFSDPKNAGLMSGMMWTLTHASRDGRAVDEILNYFQTFFTAAEKKDEATLRRLGGARGFKDKFVGYLGHADDTIQASAALILAMTGDAGLAPHVAKLLRDPRPPLRRGEYHPRDRYAGGRAAVALALLGAAQYKPDLIEMLRAANEHDRMGAAQALTLLKAADAAPHVARLLGDGNDDVRVAAIEALVDLGAARPYLKEIARGLSDDNSSEVKAATMFAFVKLRAREYAKDIAALLKARFSKSEAAVALAMLGADEYADEIAKVLEDEQPLSRCAAMLALGILGAEKYAGAIHRRMQADKSYIEYYGAVALILLEAREFAAPAMAVLFKEAPGKVVGGTPEIASYLGFVPNFMGEELRALQERLAKSYELMRAAGGARKEGAKP